MLCCVMSAWRDLLYPRISQNVNKVVRFRIVCSAWLIKKTNFNASNVKEVYIMMLVLINVPEIVDI